MQISNRTPQNYQKAITYRENPVPLRDIPKSKFALFGSILIDEKSGWDLESWMRKKPNV
jgi:hypothetical protein